MIRSTNAVIALAAEQIRGLLMEACLEWGVAINAAEKARAAQSTDLAALVNVAQEKGRHVMHLSAAVAAKVRP